MQIIIAGAGEVGTHLAKLLSRENMEISLIDESNERLGDLSAMTCSPKKVTLPLFTTYANWGLATATFSSPSLQTRQKT